jgi:hypothetical protein
MEHGLKINRQVRGYRGADIFLVHLGLGRFEEVPGFASR